ncbi:MAG: MFS transporter [Deltaproteobacteria bacterium]|nr:MFS transporter [Deltaproteobacteria bacterium]
MASFIDACAIIGSGIALVIYQHSIGTTPEQIGIFSSALILCIAIGALVGGRLGDRYGRRSVFIVTMAMIVIGSAMLSLMSSFSRLLIGMVFVGLGAGADLPVSLAAIAEIATNENRGKLLGFSQIMWIFGIESALVCSAIVGDFGRIGGQIMFGQIGVFAFITMILRMGIPESDRWKTAHSERIAGAHTVQARRAAIKDLIKVPFLKPFIVLLIFYSCTNLVANTNGQFGTYLWVNVVGKSVPFASTIGQLGLVIGVICAYWFMRICDTPKRFPYFQMGAVALLLTCLIPAILGFSTITLIISGLFGGFGLGFAFEGIMKLWTQESFPTLLRTTGQGTIITVARIFAAILAKYTPRMMDSNPRALFFLLAGLSFMGLTAAWLGFRKGAINEFDVEDQIDVEVYASGIEKGE